MSIYKTATFSSNATDNSDVYEELFQFVAATVFGGTQVGNFFTLKRSSYDMNLYTDNSNRTASYSLSFNTTKDEKKYKDIIWIETSNLVKLGGIWIWKGQYAPSYYYYLMDITNGNTCTGNIKAVKDGIVIAPLYTDEGVLIDGAYMYAGNGLSQFQIYEIGGNLYMCVNGNVLIAL